MCTPGITVKDQDGQSINTKIGKERGNSSEKRVKEWREN